MIAGPDYVLMAAGEAENSRKVMPKSFNGVFYRLTSFFVLGNLAVGILVPHNGAELKAAFENAASPYVVAMNRLKIRILPDIANSMVLASTFRLATAMFIALHVHYSVLCWKGKLLASLLNARSKEFPSILWGLRSLSLCCLFFEYLTMLQSSCSGSSTWLLPPNLSTSLLWHLRSYAEESL